MPKITDYVREGFKRRQRPWDRTELPEWWNIAVWAGVVVVVGAILLGAIFDSGSSSGDADAGAPAYPVRTLNPYGTDASPDPSASAAASADPSADPSSAPADGDFTVTAAAQVPMTGGGTAVVPVGARNVASAAATAEATGDWAAIPFTGGAKRPGRARTPLGSVIGQTTVQDPAVTGNSQYVFTAKITRGGTAAAHYVQITVEFADGSYAISALEEAR
jgi:hypothetical protein